MKRLITTFVIGLIAAVSAVSQQKPQDSGTKPPETAKPAAMPSVDEVLARYVAAIGGKEAVQKLTSRTAKGTFEIPAMGVSASAEMFAKAPNKSLLVLDIPGFGIIRDGFDGTIGWAEEPQGGLREKTGAELAASKRDNDFYRDIRLKEIYSKMELTGKEKVGDRDAYAVAATAPDGSTEKLYFDVETALMVRADTERETPQGKLPIQAFMEDYKEVDGIKMPFTLRQSTAAFSFTIKLTEVKHNVAIEDSKFAKP
ncbi:MAG TPA: hypothetical protein VJH03_18625 [Blastocatellia bacterium]|nr:hypothetical protein [Blastocatellia bacterium]